MTRQEQLDDIKALHSKKCRWGMGVEMCDDELARIWRSVRDERCEFCGDEDTDGHSCAQGRRVGAFGQVLD